MAFRNIEIKHFRGINECQIEDLKQINLFVGKNNCGKTSVLDAIFLLTSMSRADSAIRINQFRNLLPPEFSDIVSVLFYKMNLEQEINISSFGNEDNRNLIILPIFEDLNNIQLKISNATNESLSNKADAKIKKIKYRFKYKDNSYEGEIKEGTKPLNFKGTVPDEYIETIKSKYINTKSSLEFSKEMLASIIIGKDKQDIVEALQQIEPQLQNIEFSTDNRVMVDLGGVRLLPLEVLGDGIRRLLAIIISIYECENGILLIDEIDNGLHYSSMDTLWKMILSTAKKYNVQIFATSHNIDSLQALKDVLEIESFFKQQSSTVCYNLNRIQNDVLKSYQYNFEQFQYAIDMENEIR